MKLLNEQVEVVGEEKIFTYKTGDGTMVTVTTKPCNLLPDGYEPFVTLVDNAGLVRNASHIQTVLLDGGVDVYGGDRASG